MIPVRAPEQKRGVLERGTATLYLLELDRTVILSNAKLTGDGFRRPVERLVMC